MKKKRNQFMLGLFVLGLVIVIFPFLTDWYYGQKNEASFEDFMASTKQLESATVDEMLERVKQCNDDVYGNVKELHDPFSSNQELLLSMKECLGIDNDEVFAILEIPTLRLAIPIYLSSSDEILAKGIGHVEGSSLPLGGAGTHTVLAGHRGQWTQQMFKFLDRVTPGSEFYIHTLEESLRYQVKEQIVIFPEETDSLEIQPGKDMATLITCHPYGSNEKRLLIQGERLPLKNEQ